MRKNISLRDLVNLDHTVTELSAAYEGMKKIYKFSRFLTIMKKDDIYQIAMKGAQNWANERLAQGIPVTLTDFSITFEKIYRELS